MRGGGAQYFYYLRGGPIFLLFEGGGGGFEPDAANQSRVGGCHAVLMLLITDAPYQGNY